MMRLAAAVLVAALVIPSLTLRPSPPVTWLVVATLVVGGAGVVALSVPLVTAGASLALIAYALALLIVAPPFGPVAAIAFGATLVLLLVLVHFAGRVHGAAISLRVVASQIRQWLAIVAIGIVVAVGLQAGGAGLAVVLQGAALPVVVAVAALGAVITVAGVLALMTRGDPS
ncbi:MAG TPA: hypothetical protein VLG10_05465 [Methylomirabilota bacterium]|nr:hypothetical protein [Methylomirabilota bacterium]